MQEEFRKIKDFENYSISSLGNVRNDRTGRLLKPGKEGGGYLQVVLRKDNKSHTKKVHRLVGLAFIQNPLNKPSIDHIDNIITNNNINNLRWATSKEQGYNTRVGTNNTSGTKGVSWHNRDQKWQAQIMINGKQQHLGYFEKKEDAIIARSQKAIEQFGIFVNRCEVIKEKRTELDEELEQLELEFLELIK